MRELKFRIFDDKTAKFTYFDIAQSFGNIPLDLRANIQQYTGLKDKDGREIYEGDYLTAKSSDNLVYFNCEESGYFVGPDPLSCCQGERVVGNKYEK